MGDWFSEHLARRPWWMNALLFFSAFMAFVYVPWDLFVKPVAFDEEVWFGIRFHGAAAKLLALPHWAIYAAGTYGFWRMRGWLWPWAALYVAQVAFGMLLWNAIYVGGAGGIALGLASGGLFAGLAFALHGARERFQAPRPSLRERYGEWALVTGASAGIGAEFARALARDGLGCVLVARREDRLRALADELEKRQSVATRVLAVDLAAPGAAQRVLEATADLEIGVLVNNAGFGYAGRFESQEPERLREMVLLNCVAPMELARHFLPRMRARARGALIFTGSIAGLQPLPRHALYSATKSFDNLLGEALWGELRGTGVDVLVVQPGVTETEFHDVAGEVGHPGQSPAEVVEVALDALGRQPAVVDGWWNWLRGNLAYRLLPRSLLTVAAGRAIASRIPPERL